MTQYSHSRLSSFENCPRQFAYRYVEKLQVETEGVEAFLGKRVHEILERLNHHVARYGRPPSLRQVLERFRGDWKAAWHERIEVVRGDPSPGSWEERGARCLENYYRAHYPFTNGKTVALEAPLRLQLDGEGRYKLRGIVDRIVSRAEGCFEIHDYKTGAFLPRQQSLDRDRQLALYQIGLEQTYPDVQEVELVWHYLIHNKTLRSRRSTEALAELRRTTMELIDAIEAESQYAAKPGPLCRWCDYGSICPDAPESVRSALPERPEFAARLAPEPEDYGRQLSLLGE